MFAKKCPWKFISYIWSTYHVLGVTLIRTPYLIDTYARTYIRELTFLQKIMHNRLCDLGTHFECTSRKLNMFASAIDLNYSFVWDIVNGQRVKNRYCCKYRIKNFRWRTKLENSYFDILIDRSFTRSSQSYCIECSKYLYWFKSFRKGRGILNEFNVRCQQQLSYAK